ncbi:MAG: hypothetical protein HGB15_03965 [Chlorobaculum sp.]|jgi:hypothetical protein|nr:hypothetical protein [Chlorobaculum sp.]
MAQCIFSSQIYAGPTTDSQDTSNDKQLYIEEIGPTDACIRPFFIRVGKSEKSTRDIIFLTEKGYLKIASILIEDKKSAADSSTKMTFQITSLINGKQEEVYIVHSNTMVLIIDSICKTFSAQKTLTPDFLILLKNLMMSDNY